MNGMPYAPAGSPSQICHLRSQWVTSNSRSHRGGFDLKEIPPLLNPLVVPTRATERALRVRLEPPSQRNASHDSRASIECT